MEEIEGGEEEETQESMKFRRHSPEPGIYRSVSRADLTRTRDLVG